MTRPKVITLEGNEAVAYTACRVKGSLLFRSH
jgi:hypothetical protein